MNAQARLRADAGNVSILAAVVGATLVVSACTDAAAPVGKFAPATVISTGGAVRLEGRGVLTAPPLPGFSEQSRRVVQGYRPKPGFCAVTGRDTLRRGERSFKRVVEVDTVSCLVIMAKGVRPSYFDDDRAAKRSEQLARPAALQAPSLLRGPSRQVRGIGQAPSNYHDGCADVPPVDFTRAKQTVGWVDPFQIRTAWDVMELIWSWDFNCAYFEGGVHSAFWLLTTGWSNIGFYTAPVYSPLSKAYIEAWGYSFYQNTGFPLCTGTVHASVYENRVIGTALDEAIFDHDADVSGPWCTYLLSLFIDQTRDY